MSESELSAKVVDVEKGRSTSTRLWENNGFLNYLRDFVKQCGDMSFMQFAREAASNWEKLSKAEKDSYSDFGRTAMAIMAMASGAAEHSKISILTVDCPVDKVSRVLKCCTRPPKSRARPMKACATPRRKAALGKPKRRAAGPPKKKEERKEKQKEEEEEKEKEACANGDAKRKTGPITTNGYLNFLRAFRKGKIGLTPQEMVQQGALAWRELSVEEKDRFRHMANKGGASASNVSSS
ncbi:uncharacterized protein LOC108091036 [Drosophila ficusphila]|uniref:uncharacterized protein LOC108091036 n=1 Tax=Drosophila ficusphila TaxID=30025 RepID=UPI0007E7728D|nr:uncharacterized protein LOC108091036 [Drosophila ficusphila]